MILVSCLPFPETPEDLGKKSPSGCFMLVGCYLDRAVCKVIAFGALIGGFGGHCFT